MNIAAENEVVGIVKDQQTLQNAVDDLWHQGFAAHEISVQGDPEQLKAVMGKPYVDPRLIADHPNAPRKDPSMSEEFGWLLVFCIAVPLFIGIIIGSVLGSGIEQSSTPILQGFIGGGVVGLLIGIALAVTIKMRHDQRIIRQMKKGGFVIWINTDTDLKKRKALWVLQKDGAYDVHELHIKKTIELEDD